MPHSRLHRGTHLCSTLTLALAVAACQAAPVNVPVTPEAPVPAPVTAASPSAAPGAAPGAAPVLPPVVGSFQVKGLATTFDGPLAGATVTVFPLASAGEGEPLATTTSGPDGAFTLTVPQAELGVPLVVMASVGGTFLASMTVISGEVAPGAAARRLLATSETVELDLASTLVYKALVKRLRGLARMKPTPAQVSDAFVSLETALEAAKEVAAAMTPESQAEFLAAIGENGTGTLSVSYLRTLVPPESAIANALADAASAYGSLIRELSKAGIELPPDIDTGNFIFGGAYSEPVVRVRSSRGSGPAPTPVPHNTYLVEGTLMSVNREDGDVWVVSGATVTHRSASNEQIASFTWDGEVSVDRVFAVNDGSVWVVSGDGEVGHYDENGNSLYFRPLGMAMGLDVSVNPVNGDLWLANQWNSDFYFIAGTETNATPPTTYPGSTFTYAQIAVDPTQEKGVWLSYDNEGVPGVEQWNLQGGETLVSTMETSFSPTDIIFGPADSSLWMWTNSRIYNVDTSGELLDLNTGYFVSALAVDASDGSAWVANLDNEQGSAEVRHITSGKVVSASTAVPGAATLLSIAADPTDHTAWVLDNSRMLFHIGPQINVISSVDVGVSATQVGVGGNNTWVLHQPVFQPPLFR